MVTRVRFETDQLACNELFSCWELMFNTAMQVTARGLASVCCNKTSVLVVFLTQSAVCWIWERWFLSCASEDLLMSLVAVMTHDWTATCHCTPRTWVDQFSWPPKDHGQLFPFSGERHRVGGFLIVVTRPMFRGTFDQLSCGDLRDL